MVRLRRVSLEIGLEGHRRLFVELTQNGVPGDFRLAVPEWWNGSNRAEKIMWLKEQVAEYAQAHAFARVSEIIYPNNAAQEQAANDLGNLPGWATWTTEEANSWIKNNVTDLNSAKTILIGMAKAIIYLRDIVMER